MRLLETAGQLIGLLLGFVGTLLELLSCWGLFGYSSVPFASFLTFHLVGVATGAAGVWLMFPERCRGQWFAPLLFLTSSALFVPLLGLLGLLFSLLVAMHRYAPRAEGTWEQRDEVELPFKPIEVNANAVFKRAGLAAMAKYLSDQGMRRRVVMATRYLTGYRAVPILREALSDPADEVRLLAYSMLNSKERSFEVEIQRLQRELARGKNPNEDWLHEQIASLYWEQAALGLVEGEVQTYVLHQASRHVDSAMEGRITGARHLLRAKVCMRLNRLAAAEHSFAEARRLGVSDSFIVPYRAELAFRRRDFETVIGELERLSPRMRALPQFAPIVSYWQ